MQSILSITAERAEAARHARAQQGPRTWTVGDVLHGAIGAGLGLGVAKGVGGLLGLSDRNRDKLETVGIGLGAMMNTGVIKNAEDQLVERLLQMRKQAFQIGCIRALKEAGYFDPPEQKKEAFLLPVLNLDPSKLLEIPKGIGKAVYTAGGTLGSLSGAANAPDETDEDIAQIKARRMMLEEQLEKLQAERANRMLRQVLAKRRTAV